jgi:ABC-type branched-subunit amino acid transport system substrate-binding protein
VRRSSRRSCTQLTVGLVAVGLLAAACSSSNSSSSSSSASSPASPSSSGASSTAVSPGTTAAASGNAIVVGGLQDGNYAGIDTGFKARITRFNNQGGVGGRKIQFLGVLNDGDSPATDLSNAQTLVLKDHVFAVAPVADEVLGTSETTLFEQNTTPYLGWGDGPAFCGSEWGFPIAGCEASTQYQSDANYIQAVKAIGQTPKGLKVAVIGTNNAGGKAGTEGVAAVVAKAGSDVTYAQASIPQDGTTDYTPYVQAIMAGNPAIVLLIVNFNTSVGITAALRQAGYKGAIWNPDAYVPGLLTSQPQLAEALNGSLVVAQFPPAEDNTAAVQEIQSDLKAIGAPATYSLGEAVGWWSAEEFIQQLQATAAKGAITQANFEKVINAGWTIKPIAGGITDATFPADHTKPGGCFGTLLVSGKQYVQKVPFSCDPSATVSLGG